MKKFWDHFEECFCVIVSVILLLLTFANVISRYLIHASISFTDEVTTNLFVVLCVMGAALAAKRGSHLGLTILTDFIPRKYAELIGVFASLCGAFFATVVFWTGMEMVQNNIANGAVSLSLQLPTAIYSSALPVGMVFLFIRFIEAGVNHFKEFKRLSAENKQDAPLAPQS